MNVKIIFIWGYLISSNKRQASNKRHPLISAAPLDIQIEISASLSFFFRLHSNKRRTSECGAFLAFLSKSI